MQGLRLIRRCLKTLISEDGDQTDFWLLKLLRHSLIVIAALCIALLDPLGLGDATDKRSKDAFYQIVSPYHSTSYRDATTLILIDEETISSQTMSWPVQFNQLTDLLYFLEMYEPQTIFLDFVFLDERNAPDKLALLGDAMSALKDEVGIPLFIGAPNVALPVKANATSQKCAQTLSDVKNGATAETLIASAGFSDSYPLNGYVECDGSLIASPALSIYRHLCASVHCENAGQLVASPDTVHHPLSLREGDTSSPLNAKLYPASFSGSTPQCRNERSSWAENFQGAVAYLFGGLFAALDGNSDKRPCLYQPHLGVSHLYELDQTDPELLETLVSGKNIMIGVSLTGLNDYWDAPVHGKVPGVVAHATALENLMLWGEGYTRPAPTVLLEMVYSDVLEILTLIVVMYLQFYALDKMKQSKSRYRKTSILLGGIFLIALIILVVSSSFIVFGAYASMMAIGAIVLSYLGVEALGRGLLSKEPIDTLETKTVIEILSIYSFFVGSALLICIGSISMSLYLFHYAPMNWLGVFMLVFAFIMFLTSDVVSYEGSKG